MAKEYLFFYTESMIVCIIIFSILLVHDLVQGDRQERKFRFDNVLLSHIMYFICDGIWAAIIAGAIPRTPFSVLLVNYLLLFLLALVSCSWFFFITVLTNMPKRTSKRGKMMIYLPMIATSAFALVGMVIKPSLWITPDLKITTMHEVIFLLAPLIYMICAFGYSFYSAFKKENLLNRKLYLIAGIFPLAVLISGLFQVIVANAPIFCYSTTIVIILFNLLSLEEQISVDPLTKLNNRGQVMRYVTQETSLHKEGLHSFVVMADVNGFKKINDTYGHAEGDHALIMIADAMRQVVEELEIPPFLGRYGGDEFIMIVYFEEQANVQERMEEIISSIRNSLRVWCEERQMPYTITMGFGYDEIGESDSFMECMKRADQKLYQDKAQMKGLRIDDDIEEIPANRAS